MFTRSTVRRPSLGKTRKTLPCLPRSFPATTLTISSFLTCPRPWETTRFVPAIPCPLTVPSKYFRRQRDDFHVAFGAQLTRHGSKNARPNRFSRIIYDDCRIVVKTDVGPIDSTNLFPCAYYHRSTYITLFNGRVGQGFLNGNDDHISHVRVTSPCPSKHMETLHLAGTGIVSHIENCFLLYHPFYSSDTAPDPDAIPIRRRTISCKRQRFVRLSGRVSTIRTTSPIRH